MRRDTPTGRASATTQPGFASPVENKTTETNEAVPASAIVPVASFTQRAPPARESSAPPPVTIHLAGQLVNVSRVSHGTYEVRSEEAMLIGTITLSHGFLQLTAEKTSLATMIEIVRIAMGLGVLTLPAPRPGVPFR